MFASVTQLHDPKLDMADLEATKEYILAHPAKLDMDWWENPYTDFNPTLTEAAPVNECGTTHCIGGTQLVLRYGVKLFDQLPLDVREELYSTDAGEMCLTLMGVPLRQTHGYTWLYHVDRWPMELRERYKDAFKWKLHDAMAAIVVEVIQMFIDTNGEGRF